MNGSETESFPSIPAEDIDPLWRAGEVAARDGGSSRDEIYGCSQFRANGRPSMRFYSPGLIAATYRQAFVFAYRRGLRQAPGATVNMTDGCDDEISAASEQTSATLPGPENLDSARFRGDERPRPDRGSSSTANRYTWLRGQTKSTSEGLLQRGRSFFPPLSMPADSQRLLSPADLFVSPFISRPFDRLRRIN